MAGFIAAQRDVFGVPHAVACRALGISPAWFYKWRHGDGSVRRARRAELSALVAALFRHHHGSYGSPRITADLWELGWRVSVNTVAALMADQHLVARPKRRRRATTRPGRGRWRAPDLVGRDFAAAGLNQRWFADGTEIDTDEGKLYLASVLDVRSRRAVGFALGEHHDAELAYSSLAMAVTVRGGQVAGVVLHSDGGSELGFKGVVATPAVSDAWDSSSANASAGVLHPSVLRGRPLSAAATASRFPRVAAEVGALREVLAQQPVRRSYVCQAPAAMRVAGRLRGRSGGGVDDAIEAERVFQRSRNGADGCRL